MTVIAIAVAAFGWCAGWLVGVGRRLPAGGRRAASISVVVPARNEARRLPHLLASLDPRAFEIVVADDGSTDATSAIAREANARVLPVSPPPGWNGKPWACWMGAQMSSGDIIVFLDADTELPTETVETLAALAAETGGLVSLQPRHRVTRWYEQLSALPALVAVMGAGTGPAGTMRWWRRPAAFGMALAIPRDVYFAAGGHARVRGEIAEDLALARAVDATGAPVAAWCGAPRGTIRMYGEGPAQLVRGWTKNLAAGAHSLPPLRLAVVVAWVAAVAQACALVVAAPFGVSTTPVAVALAIYAAVVFQTAVLAHRIGPFARGAVVALPVFVAAFCAMFVASVALSISGRTIAWRGRQVSVGARP